MVELDRTYANRSNTFGGIRYVNRGFLDVAEQTMQESYNQEQLVKAQTPKPNILTGLIKKLFKN